MATGSVERYLIDSNIFDRIIDEAGMLDLVSRLHRDGVIELLATHVQRDELANVPDPERRDRLLTVPVNDVPTFGFVIDVSPLGQARLAPEEPFETLRAGADRMKRTNDALISMTAQFEQATLVSEDKDMRERAAQLPHVVTWTWLQLRERLLSLDATQEP